MRTKELKKQLKEHARPEEQSDKPMLIPSGSTMLDLACSDTIEGAYKTGSMINIIGDSFIGKTSTAYTTLAEAARQPKLDDYEFIFDNVEASDSFDVGKMFGMGLRDRIKEPKTGRSNTLLDFFGNINDELNEGHSFIYVLDSLDALTTEDEIEKAEEEVEASRKGSDVKGSYGMSKAKGMSEKLRIIVGGIEESKSLLIIISQTRTNINPRSFVKKTRSGGKALKFYCSHEIWLADGGPHKSKKRVIGTEVKAKITKNKLTGKIRQIQYPIYVGYGIDDIGSCTDFLLEEGVWRKSKNSIVAPEFHFKGSREKLILAIETNDWEPKLKRLARRAWAKVEKSLDVNRKPKYG